MESNYLTAEVLKKSLARGVVVLGIRRVLFQLILTLSNIVLIRILDPAIFGSFAILSFIVISFGGLTNWGLTVALIQKRTAPKVSELRAVFTLIFLSSIIFSLVIWLCSPLVSHFYQGKLVQNGIFWLKLLPLSLILNNLAAVSSVLLERKLAYAKIAIGELGNLFLVQTVAIILALANFGLGSLVLANLVGAIFTFIYFFAVASWPIGLNFSFSRAGFKKLFSFGINCQANGLISIADLALVPGLVGRLAGASAVGLINWAGGVSAFGLAPQEAVSRMVFPACARTREKKYLRLLLERMTQFSCFLSFPLLAIIFSLAPAITILVYSSKWLPGLTALYLLLIKGFFLVLGGILGSALFALGEVKTVRNFSFFCLIFQWVLALPLFFIWNFNGVVLADVLVSLAFVVLLKKLQRQVRIDFWSQVLPYFGYSVLTGVMLLISCRFFIIDSVFKLLLAILTGILIYMVVVTTFERRNLIKNWQLFKDLIFSSNK